MNSDIALKEWTVVVQALESGRQLLLLRKGGIRDPRGAFQLEHREFLLYPTAEHQEEQFIQPECRGLFPVKANAGSADRVEFRVYAGVALVQEIRNLKILTGLEEYHLWTPEFLEKRMSYRPRSPLLAVVVRAYRLPKPVFKNVRPEYAGCKSWVTLAEPVSLEGAEPVVENRRFRSDLEKIAAGLEG